MYNFKVQLGEAEKVIKELRAEKEVSFYQAILNYSPYKSALIL